jgi:hypothetical protein
MGVFVQDDSPPMRPMLGNDDGLHCSSCRRETNIDDHECNVCSRNWAATRGLVHTGWHPKDVR